MKGINRKIPAVQPPPGLPHPGRSVVIFMVFYGPAFHHVIVFAIALSEFGAVLS